MLLLIQLLMTGNEPKSTPFNPLVVVQRCTRNVNQRDGSLSYLQKETVPIVPHSPFMLRLYTKAKSGNLDKRYVKERNVRIIWGAFH